MLKVLNALTAHTVAKFVTIPSAKFAVMGLNSTLVSMMLHNLTTDSVNSYLDATGDSTWILMANANLAHMVALNAKMLSAASNASSVSK